jgi:hypothetical protein
VCRTFRELLAKDDQRSGEDPGARPNTSLIWLDGSSEGVALSAPTSRISEGRTSDRRHSSFCCEWLHRKTRRCYLLATDIMKNSSSSRNSRHTISCSNTTCSIATWIQSFLQKCIKGKERHSARLMRRNPGKVFPHSRALSATSAYLSLMTESCPPTSALTASSVKADLGLPRF